MACAFVLLEYPPHGRLVRTRLRPIYSIPRSCVHRRSFPATSNFCINNKAKKQKSFLFIDLDPYPHSHRSMSETFHSGFRFAASPPHTRQPVSNVLITRRLIVPWVRFFGSYPMHWDPRASGHFISKPTNEWNAV
jgi:hypothetical protein